MPKVNVDLPYIARKQFVDFHRRRQRWACMICHRRAGKTVASLMDLLDAAIDKPNGRYCYIAPLRNQAKTVAWDYLTAFARPVQASSPNQAELHVDLVNGARITLFGADNPDALRGPFFDGAVLDEYADIAPSLFRQVVRPALADRKGFAIVLGTVKGRNQLWELYRSVQADPDWYTALLRASETGILPSEELAEMRRQMTPEQYAAELECDPAAAIMGAYYGKEITACELEGRIKANLVVLPGPMHTAWDFGNGLNMAVWVFQVGANGPLIHDFIQMSGAYFEDYLKEVVARGYDGFDYVPHDAKVPSFETGRTRIETMAAFKRKPVLVADHKVDDGINAAKLMLPRAQFNADKCESGIEALRQYVQEWDDKARVFKKAPKHDWASHCLAGDTKILTRNGMCPIKDLPNQGEVLTKCGWKQYRNPRITARNAPLVEVEFADGLTVKCTPDHLFLTASGWKFASDLRKGSSIQSCLTRSRNISTAVSIVFGAVKGILQKAVKRFTEMYGAARLARFREDAISTTGIAIISITQSRTSNALTRMNTWPGLQVGKTDRLGSLWRKRRNGIDRKLGFSGIGVMLKGAKVGINGSENQGRAKFAARSFSRLSVIANSLLSFARTTVSLHTFGKTTQAIIEKVSACSERSDVWCVTVPDGESYSLANGAIVHNSADALRYLAMAWREMKNVEPPEPPRLFIPTEEMTIGDWVKYSTREGKRERA